MVARTQKKLELPTPLGIQPEELELLNPSPRISMSKWAPDNYVLTGKTAAIPGPWKNENAPYLVVPMDRLSGPAPVRVTISACTQAGKSEVGNIFTGWSIDQCPEPFIFAMPTLGKVKTRANTRLRPMFQKNEKLMKHLGHIRNLNIGSETNLDNMLLYLCAASSELLLSDISAGSGCADEVGKWLPGPVEAKGNPLSNFDSRFRTYRSRSRRLIVSSPGVVGDMFDLDHKNGSDEKYWVECLFCSTRHVQSFKNVQLDKTADGKLLEPSKYKAGGHARYLCPKCKKAWRDSVRWSAVQGGKWLPEGVKFDEHGNIVGEIKPTQHYSYSITCFMLNPEFFSLDDLAAEWASAQIAKNAGDKQPLRSFITDQLDQPWKEMGKEVDIEKMKRKGGDIGRGIVPVGCKLLVGGMDYHETEDGTIRIDFCKLAIADGPRGYVIDVGAETGHKSKRAELERNVEARMFDETHPWSKPCELPRLAVTRAFIDSGFKSDEVYDWCLQVNMVCPGLMRATKGHDHQRVPSHSKKLDDVLKNARRVSRQRKAKDYRGEFLYHLDTTHFKDMLFNWANNQIPGRGYLEFACDLDDWFFLELCAEHKVGIRKGAETVYSYVPKGRTPSHGLDILVEAMAAGRSAGMLKMRVAGDNLPAAAKGKKKKKKLSEIQATRRNRR